MSVLAPIPAAILPQGDVTPAMRQWMGNALVDAIGFDNAISALQAGRRARSVLINGDFAVWQRGITFASAAARVYAADRWALLRTGGALGATLSQQAGPPGHRFCARLQRNAADANTSAPQLGYSMESADAIPLAGQTVTLSFMARAGATLSGSAAVRLSTGTGTDQSVLGAYTGQVDAITAAPVLTTAWQFFQYTATLAANANEAGIVISFNPVGIAGASDYIEVAGVQLEIAPAFSVFDYVPFAQQLQMCQRYFRKSFAYAAAPAQNAGTTGTALYKAPAGGTTAGYACQVVFAPYLRATPTVTTFNPSAANANWRNVTLGADSGVPSINASDTQLTIANGQVAGDAASNNIAIHWTADAEI